MKIFEKIRLTAKQDNKDEKSILNPVDLICSGEDIFYWVQKLPDGSSSCANVDSNAKGGPEDGLRTSVPFYLMCNKVDDLNYTMTAQLLNGKLFFLSCWGGTIYGWNEVSSGSNTEYIDDLLQREPIVLYCGDAFYNTQNPDDPPRGI